MAIVLAAMAAILGKASDSPHAAEAPAADGSARVAMHDDRESVRLAVGYAAGEVVTRLVIEDPAAKSQVTLNFFKGGGAYVAFDQRGPNQAVAWWNRDGTVAFTARSPKGRVQHHAQPDGAVRLIVHAIPAASKVSEVIQISAEGALTHEALVMPPTGGRPAPLKEAIRGQPEGWRKFSAAARNH